MKKNSTLDFVWIRPIFYKTSVIPGVSKPFSRVQRHNLVNIINHLWLCIINGLRQHDAHAVSENRREWGRLYNIRSLLFFLCCARILLFNFLLPLGVSMRDGGIKRPGRVIPSTHWLDYVQTLLRGRCSILIAIGCYIIPFVELG